MNMKTVLELPTSNQFRIAGNVKVIGKEPVVDILNKNIDYSEAVPDSHPGGKDIIGQTNVSVIPKSLSGGNNVPQQQKLSRLYSSTPAASRLIPVLSHHHAPPAFCLSDGESNNCAWPTSISDELSGNPIPEWIIPLEQSPTHN